ncbi:uncharacterized protein LOC143055170 [Mytilus galloprovincialis]|uniref:uncharacterized protein LOC143055170 n=1 Tax=Mytilus galloprovincialis TaxID=29158 RepID=UPI003F7B402A
MYKDCLDRRKTHENWILNLRYPDKASNEYLDYLDNCIDCNKEYLSWTENDSIENQLVKHLIRTVGTEIDIRNRQLLFVLHDKICNANNENVTHISSGSLAEGLNLPGSDTDIMIVDDVVNVTHIDRIMKCPVQQEVDIDTFQLPKLFVCFFLCLNKLISWVNNCYCPNYFIPEHNMFLGKINHYNNTSLISVLNSIKNRGISGLMQNLFHSYTCNISCYPPYSKHSDQSVIMLDFLFYRISDITANNTLTMSNLTKNYNVLTFIESLQNSEQSTFNIGVCKYHHATISQYAAQLLPSLKTMNTNYKIRKRYHRHLHDGIQRDAVTGWLLYASFYYVTEQYNITLRLTEYVLSKLSHDMVSKNKADYSEADIDNYRHNVHSMSLNVRMKTAVVDNILYLKHSSLIPKELELEVEDKHFEIPPIIMFHFLRFLCYHHIGDTFNRQNVLRNLRVPYYVSTDSFSNCLTLIGVCCEISDDTDAAFRYYDEALQWDDGICSSADKRKSRLLNI